ncbi:threonine-phosphate decarboxylase CobD [Herbaspirillum sp. SJZ107]|uniref:threonine-phosphate decarboxylase CobD n=1 Tax=Herbaspirillum sp. SJZ107 TaxID=2572881 RepID=UPI00114F20B5|nr:threonine-phosphate decarboxylase CobD [Herbaspirillum sp. SJZ107]TQK00125.1 L-threonine O-3-phosphate decarboxylase [Herbaspirillum sp. SJZ107]
MLEHGGKLREAMQRYGGSDWIDLSTGINPVGYPAPALSPDAWQRLPEPDPALVRAACAYYDAPGLLPVAGTQAAIQALPRLRAPARVSVSAPSYAEHAHHWSRHGHVLRQVPYTALDAAVRDSDVVVIVNPNNPTGATVPPGQLLAWHAQLAARGGWLVVDEAFGDTAPALSIAAYAEQPGLIVLRSVGKFFGLAGLRLGFVAAAPALLAQLEDLLGPWAVSGPAQEIALAALRDRAWQQATQARLARDGERMRALLPGASGTPLFHWWAQAQPEAFHEHMARRAIWVRLFRDAARGIRIGLPATEAHWQRLEQALRDWNQR